MADDAPDPVADDELLYRRISAASGWYTEGRGLNDQAFAPHKVHDVTGLSVARAKYKSIEQAARPVLGKPAYVAVLLTSDLRQKGIRVVPRPLPGDPGHAELPDLTAENRKEARTLEFQRLLVGLSRVEGPYSASSQS